MKVLQVIPDLGSGKGGPSRSVPALCRALIGQGVEVLLFSHSAQGVENTGCPVQSGKDVDKRDVLQEMDALLKSFQPDLVHFNGIWTPSMHWDEVLCRERDIPYVIAPMGMLEPWSLQAKKWKKRLAMWLYQRHDLQRAAALHATAESEEKQFRQLGFSNPVILSPNGVAFPEEMPAKQKAADGKRHFLFLSRIHPKKGLVELVRAWADVPHDGWQLDIAGTDADGYQRVVQQEVERVGVSESVSFLGAFSDAEKWSCYRKADCFVLPTYTENFGIVIAEALAAELPVITTRGTPWAELVSEKCGWWIEIGHEPLKAALQEAMVLTDEQRTKMGQRGRALVEREYQWDAAAAKMKRGYEKILEQWRKREKR